MRQSVELTRRSLALGAAGLALSSADGAEASAKRRRQLLLPDTRWETSCYDLDSGVPGSTVMIVAGIHGNETAPPHAASELLGRMPRRGRLVVVPEANQPALARRSRFSPGAAQGDLNRSFPTSKRPAPRGQMAAALWQLTLAVAPDWVLDLHEGWGYSASSSSMGSSIVRAEGAATDAETLPKARLLLEAINATVDHDRKKFRIIGPGPLGSYARSLVEQLKIPALVLETTWVQPLELRIEQQLLLAHELLAALGLR